MKTPIKTDKAAAAVGAYVQGVAVGNLIFTSGQLGLNPETALLEEGVEAQTKRALENVKAILEAGGSSLDHVIKTMIFLADINDFAKVNEIYQSYFEKEYPARSCVQAAALPKGGLVEIEAIAEKAE